MQLKKGDKLYRFKSGRGIHDQCLIIEGVTNQYAFSGIHRFKRGLCQPFNSYWEAVCTSNPLSRYQLETEDISREFEKHQLVERVRNLLFPPPWETYTNEDLKKIINFHETLKSSHE